MEGGKEEVGERRERQIIKSLEIRFHSQFVDTNLESIK
jgi:hypothetical protein